MGDGYVGICECGVDGGGVGDCREREIGGWGLRVIVELEYGYLKDGRNLGRGKI